MEHFIKFGYEGVKLAHIASDSGIKKQSLNYYYKNKEALFNELLSISVIAESNYIRGYFANQDPSHLEQCLYHFFIEYKERFLKCKSATFLNILSAFPPLHLREETLDTYRQYNALLKEEIEKTLEPYTEQLIMPVSEVANAYVTVLDGLVVQLIYETPEHYIRSLHAIWPIFWSGMIVEKRN